MQRGRIEVCIRLGKKNWIRSKAAGFSGRVWILWDDSEINMKLEYAHRFFLHLLVRSAMGREWEFTTVYASPNPRCRKYLCGKLDGIRVGRLWLLMSDFNCVLKAEEKSSNKGESTCFINWIENRGMIDLGFVGNHSTWSHGVTTETRRALRLDRALSCNM